MKNATVTYPCLVCGGRGSWPTTYQHAWVPPTGCARCNNTGLEPNPSLTYTVKEPHA